MFHQLLVNQSVTKEAKVSVHYVHAPNVMWTYETLLKPTEKTISPVFPITLSDDTLKIVEKKPGRETTCQLLPEDKIRFTDDYAIPEGTVVCVTGPKGYYPEFIKLKNKPTIVQGGFTQGTPAHFEVKSNQFTEQVSVLMHIMQRTYFGICIEFARIDDDFPFGKEIWHRNDFDVTLSMIGRKLEIIDSSDILEFHPNMEVEKTTEIVNLLNELVEIIKHDEDDYYDVEVPNELKERIRSIVPVLIASSSSVVTLIDSYINGGAVGQLLAVIMKYFS